MASIRNRHGWLYIDFRWRGVRCREATRFRDTREHRAQVRRQARQIDGEIAAGTFEYRKWFPESRRAALFDPPVNAGPPHYKEYVLHWLEDKAARLAAGTAYDRRRILQSKLIPFFGDRLVSDITTEDVEAFIAALKRAPVEDPDAGAPTRKKRLKLSNRRVNIILQVLRQSLDRAVRRGWLETNPAREVERLREDKPEILPLSLDEVRRFLDKGLTDDWQRRYFTVAFFSGLRPSEQIGLKWDDLDWQRKLIGVRRARTRWGEGVTKTVAASREVDMLPAVERALRAQRAASQLRSPWVFPNTQGGPLDITNLRERVWRPALRRAGLRHRSMYQTRHTFATLALASGEDIGWVAKTLGHTSTEMIIRRYHRFIPNLTRRDGSAITGLAEQHGF